MLTLLLIPIIFLSGCDNHNIPPTPSPHVYKGELMMEWQGKDSIKSGETIQLKVWAKNTDDRSLSYLIELSAEGTGIVNVSINGQSALNVNTTYESVQPTAQTSQKIFDVKGTTETTSQTVKITARLYAENNLVKSDYILLKINK